MGDDTHDVLRTKELLTGAIGIDDTTSSILIKDGTDFNLGNSDGTKIGVGSADKLGFWGVTPVVQEDVTAAGITAATLLTALDKIGILNSV